MPVIIRENASEYFDWLVESDRHVKPDWVRRCIENSEYLVADSNGKNVGFLRFSWFWGKIPYMDMIVVSEDNRCLGIGTRLFEHWETTMKQAGASILMTSAMADEPEPQAWHERNGFVRSGQLTFGRMQETPEVFFIKPRGVFHQTHLTGGEIIPGSKFDKHHCEECLRRP